MPIYRLSAQEIRGFVIDDNRERAIEIVSRDHRVFAALVERAVTDYGLHSVQCPPGTTDVTPAYWRRNRAYHYLEVLPGGENANYHIVPRDHNMEPAEYTALGSEIVVQDLPGTRVVRIPQDQIVFPVVGPVAEDPRLRVHEIIMHSAEPPPF
jgi:hypothetical protein